MKTFTHITEEIKSLSNEINETKNKIDAENNRFRLEAKNMTFDERMEYWEATADEREKSAEVIVELEEKHTKQKLTMKLMQHNARTTLFYETLPIIIEVWNKYKGKRCGEKTYQKIKDEIFEKTGKKVWLGGFHNDTFHILDGFAYANGYEVKAYTKYEHNILIDNVIQEITMDDFQDGKQYVENIEVRVEKMLKVYKEAMEKKKELEAVYSLFNALTVDGIEPLYMTKNSYSII